MQQQLTDPELIDALGGPAALVKRLGLTSPFALQRVSNWRVRGIPKGVRLDYLDLWKEAGMIALEHRHTGRPLPTYRQRRRAEAAARLG